MTLFELVLILSTNLFKLIRTLYLALKKYIPQTLENLRATFFKDCMTEVERKNHCCKNKSEFWRLALPELFQTVPPDTGPDPKERSFIRKFGMSLFF